MTDPDPYKRPPAIAAPAPPTTSSATPTATWPAAPSTASDPTKGSASTPPARVSAATPHRRRRVTATTQTHYASWAAMSSSYLLGGAARSAAALQTYDRDMTAAAGDADPVIGRADEIDRVVCTLCRRTKNSAVLVGAPGVGKTAGRRRGPRRRGGGARPRRDPCRDRVPRPVRGADQEGDPGGGGGRRRGGPLRRRDAHAPRRRPEQGQRHRRRQPAEAGAGPRPHPLRRRHDLLKEYARYVEKDAAFERRLQKVHVEEPSTQATIAILQGLKQRYEGHHGLRIEDAAIVAAVQLAGRYITGQEFFDYLMNQPSIRLDP
ncbi:hypothetical protein ACP4OV_005833 [Aristida adscensionis]